MSRMPLAATLWPPSKMSSTCTHDLVLFSGLILPTVGPHFWFEWSKWCTEWHLLAMSPCRKINSWKMSLLECRFVGMWGWLLLLCVFLTCVFELQLTLELLCLFPDPIPQVQSSRIKVSKAYFFYYSEKFLIFCNWYNTFFFLSLKSQK